MAILAAVATTVLGAAFAGFWLGLFMPNPAPVFLAPLAGASGITWMLHVPLTWVVTIACAHLAMLYLRTDPDTAACRGAYCRVNPGKTGCP